MLTTPETVALANARITQDKLALPLPRGRGAYKNFLDRKDAGLLDALAEDGDGLDLNEEFGLRERFDDEGRARGL